ncbi:MAG: RDD family protein [Alphaproteobacteria bacterium]|nr:RDD family protein [Alphaproteobacteria bacterium]
MSGAFPALDRLLGADRWSPIDPARLNGVLARRVVAYAIDFCIIAVSLAFAALFFLGVSILTIGLLTPSFGLLMLLPAAYHSLTIGLTGATLGQRALGLIVVDTRLQLPSVLQALVQTLLFYLTVGPTGGLVLLLVFILPRGCTLHDIVAGTQVIRRAPSGGEILGGRTAA